MRPGVGHCAFIAIAGAAVLALTAADLPRRRIISAPDYLTMRERATPQAVKLSLSRDYLNGAYANPLDSSTTRLIGAPWDYTINYSYQDNCRGCGVSGLARLANYPVIIDLYHVQSTYPDFAMAADGDYDVDYRQTARQLAPYASQIYAVRIDSEFNGLWSAASAFAGRHAVAPSRWIAGFRRMVAAVRMALPGAKIIWNPNIGQHNPFPYYPGDDVVDLIGPDIYCQPAYFSTSAACWDEVLHGASGSNLDAFAAFAEAHHKPIVVPEWSDTFGDGTVIRHMRNWMDQNHVVAQSYWDSGDALSRTAALPVLTINQRTYVEAFGHRPYSGTYWPQLIPVPADTRPR